MSDSFFFIILPTRYFTDWWLFGKILLPSETFAEKFQVFIYVDGTHILNVGQSHQCCP